MVSVGQYIVLSRDVVVGDIDFTANVGEKDNIAKVLKEFTYNIEEEYVSAAPTKEHYEFAGWAEGEKIEKGSTGAKTLTAEWKPVEYKINYVLSGGTNHASNPGTYNIEGEVTLQNPTREHYQFVKWTEGSTISVGSYGEKTFTAEWAPVEYEITLVLNGGEGETSVKYNIETETFELPKPTRNNYAFKGWFANEDLSGDEVVSIEQGTTGAKTYYAKWEEAPYQVEYETNGGNSLNPTAFSLATGFPSELPVPTKEGYEFAGWYDNEELSGEKVTEITEYKNYKLYASWEAAEYDITYVLNGGTNNEANPAKYTIEQAVELKEPTRLGYKFLGWSNEGKVELGSTGAKEFEATWEVVTYEITYVVNGGEIKYHDLIVEEFLKDFSAFTGSEITTPAAYWQAGTNRINFFKNEEMHTKWSWVFKYLAAVAKEQGMTTQYIDKLISYPVVESEAVYGYQNLPLFMLRINNSLWNANYKATYGGLSSSYTALNLTGVTFEAYKSYLPAQFDFIYANKYTVEDSLELHIPEKVGYTFDGWCKNEDLSDEAFKTLEQGSSGNVSLYAKWTPVEYTINYVLGGGTNHASNPSTYNIEDEVTLQNPTREHYEFVKWTEGSTISVGSYGEKTFTAEWAPVEYEITLVLNGGEGETSVKYNIETETFELPKPTKTDFVFKGWFANEDLSGDEVVSIEQGSTGAKTYYAKWEEAPYQVVYNANGGTYSKTDEYFSLATGLPVLEEPTRAGYEFAGWYDNAELSGEKLEALSEYKDYQLYAKWEIVTYTITYVNDGDEVENKESYTVETETFDIADASKAGYTFLGWYNGEQVVNEVVKGSTGNLELVAKYEVIEYTISYDLVGGTWSPYATYEEIAADLLADYNASAGKSYTKETFFALGSWSEPSNAPNMLYKEAYRAKWAWLVDYIATVASSANKKAWQNFNNYNSSSDLNAANGNYIYEISYEMRAFVAGSKYTSNANFITADYSQASIQSGALAAYNPANLPTVYTVEETVTLPTPNKAGYSFNGWAEADSIEKGSIGNKTFTATWTEKAAFIGETGYDTVAAALEAANEGDTIKVALGTFAESLTVNKNNITIEGILSGSSYAALASMSVKGNNIQVRNLKFTAVQGLNIQGGENITIDNCYLGSSTTTATQQAVSITGNVTNFSLTNSTIAVSSTANYYRAVFADSGIIVTNANISNNTFTSNTTESIYTDSVRLNSIAGTITIENNKFNWPGNNFTVFLGSNSCAEDSIINFRYNQFTNSIPASGISFRNLKSSCTVNIIGNDIKNVKGTTIEARGTGTSDTTTAATANIKNNALTSSASIKLTIGLAPTNVIVDSNYTSHTPIWGSTTTVTITNPKADATSALAGAK